TTRVGRSSRRYSELPSSPNVEFQLPIMVPTVAEDSVCVSTMDNVELTNGNKDEEKSNEMTLDVVQGEDNFQGSEYCKSSVGEQGEKQPGISSPVEKKAKPVYPKNI